MQAVLESIRRRAIGAGLGGRVQRLQHPPYKYPTGASILTLAPSGVVFGSAGFTLTIIGSSSNGFQTNHRGWNGMEQKLVSTYVDTVTMTATVPANLVAKVGTAYVNTYTPQSGTGMKDYRTRLHFWFTGHPILYRWSRRWTPNTAPACGSSCGNASVKITIAGSNFLPTSTNGASTVTFTGVSTSEVRRRSMSHALLDTDSGGDPGTMLADAEPNAQINVINRRVACAWWLSGVGGGPSLEPQTFTITGGAAAAEWRKERRR